MGVPEVAGGAPWSIVARNLSGHANNPIHSDEGARAAGFERALVAGVTTYAYCCHPVLERFGPDWLARGEATMRFRAPVFSGDLLTFPVSEREDGGLDVLVFCERSERPLVEVSAWPERRPSGSGGPGESGESLEPGGPGGGRPGETLMPLIVRLDGEYGSDYALRAGDDDSFTPSAGLVHPAVWPSLANTVFHAQLARGAWVHTRSTVRHYAAVPEGQEAEVSTVVIERYSRGGQRAVADHVIRVGGQVVATLEHEAIVDLSAI